MNTAYILSFFSGRIFGFKDIYMQEQVKHF